MEYALQISTLICIYVIAAVSLDLLVGHTGVLSVCHAAFFGLGAYCEALMALHLSTPFVINICVAMIISGVLACAVAIPSFRLRGDSFVIATLAFQVVLTSGLNNWPSVTGGPAGLAGVPSPAIFGYRVSSQSALMLLTAAFLGGTTVIYLRVTRSPFGRVLRSIREDELFAQSMGKAPTRARVAVFAVSGALAGIGGALFAHYLTFIDPASFTLMESVFMLGIVIIGGAGSLWGPVVGSVVLVTLPELLRFVGLPSSVAANIRQILYGGLLVVFMMLRPQGLVGEYKFEKGGSEK